MVYTLKLLASGNRGATLFEGSYDTVMNLAHALELCPSDVVSLEVWDVECTTHYKWLSPFWND